MKNADMPAYSAPNIIGSGSHNTINAPSGTGVTKRELFAAMAMQGLLASGLFRQDPSGVRLEALVHADALLAALEPKP